MRSPLAILLAILAPYACLGCGAEGRLVCQDCRGLLPVVEFRCYKCFTPRPNFRTCPACQPVAALASVQAAGLYDGLAKQLVLRLKFSRAQDAATEAAAIMADRLGFDRLMAADGLVITHAPTATSRVRRRGYDQAQLIACSLAHLSGIPYLRLLNRVGQSEQLGVGKSLRRQQLQAAYRPINQRQIAGQRILLVDDVSTTGASLEAAARTLRQAGARQVDGLVFAKA